MSNVPDIRFKGFTDAWEQRKLGEVVKIKDSARVPNVKWQTEGIPYLRSSDLNCDDKKDRLYLSLEDYLIYKSKTGAPEKGDMLFASGGEIGLAIYVENDSPIYVQGGSILYTKTSKSKDLDGLYLKYSFESPSIKSFIKGASTGTSLKHFVLKQASSLPICFPDISEQISISKLFENLDNTITLLQRKINNLNKVKKGLLQKLFPTKQSINPRIRFNGFNQDWEQRNWSDTVEISTEMVNPKDIEFEDFPHIAPGNIESFTGKVLDNVKKVKEENLISGKFRFRPNDIIYGKINPQLGKYTYANIDGLTSADAYVLKSKCNLEQIFLYQLIQTTRFYNYSVMVSRRSGMPKINRQELSSFDFLAPNKDEQIAIGNLLFKTEKTITLLQKELEMNKQIKKGFLQKLFPKE